MAQKKSVTGLSVMSIQLRPQILSLLSIEIPTVFNHTADIKKKMIPKLSMYLTTFMMQNNYQAYTGMASFPHFSLMYFRQGFSTP